MRSAICVASAALTLALASAQGAQAGAEAWSATCGAPAGGGAFQACGKSQDSAVNRCLLLGQGGNVRLIDVRPSAQCAGNPRALTSAPIAFRNAAVSATPPESR